MISQGFHSGTYGYTLPSTNTAVHPEFRPLKFKVYAYNCYPRHILIEIFMLFLILVILA